ncbi:PepSY-associated TM helix domain-containing protein [Sphingobacterium sp. SGR-19]|uniref:PepSY-associated TM helix domain-containing protein n=1 Tax=Sphingobacterium sp. SGR-19 TaxID=2710886 RepID=UPI0013EB6073|nr:PepSY-associated TM helix domain-containing protein [Sphingobacterium sp. SGR-19]NGM66514.1 PepSY domain-containing protein [Sphingobacterium sp. SGR-19]
MSKSKPKKDNSTWSKVRKFFNDIHLWGGLISGIVVFVVCLTGTIYVYNTELREAALPEYYKVEKKEEKIIPDTLLYLAKPAINGTITGVKIPFHEGKAMTILYDKSSKEENGGGRGGRRRYNQMMIDPYTGDVLGDPSNVKTKTGEFMGKMFGLHRWLLLNEVEEPIIEGVENRKLGSWITGTATLLFLLGVLTGLVIWFPKKMRSWKNGFRIRWTANWKRVNHDLHNTLGLYTWIILFLMAITGPFWSFEWYREGWQKTWGTYQDRNASREEKIEPVSKLIDGKRAMTIEETILTVNTTLPYDGDITINFASDSTGTVGIVKNKIGFFAPSASDRLTLDQYTGEVLEKDIFREKSIRNRIGSSVKALHIGDVYGPFSKLLYFISCLVATSLPVTGVLIWVNKMKKNGKKKV